MNPLMNRNTYFPLLFIPGLVMFFYTIFFPLYNPKYACINFLHLDINMENKIIYLIINTNHPLTPHRPLRRRLRRRRRRHCSIERAS